MIGYDKMRHGQACGVPRGVRGVLGRARATAHGTARAHFTYYALRLTALTPRGGPAIVDRAGTWHAQAGQDRTIARLFGSKRDGYFVDLAV